MINLYINPNRYEDLPQRGGVREHIVQLIRALTQSSKIQLLPYRATQMAQVQHIEATYIPVSDAPMVYNCHGGFIPAASKIVIRNLRRADIIITVADWLANRFFKELAYKTVTIPNGVNLDDFKGLPKSGLEPGYILYSKEWTYFFEDFIQLSSALPKQRFVTTAWPKDLPLPPNVNYIGLQPSIRMKAIIKDAGLLLLTGSEVCPISLLEAWAAGVPALAKAIDGNVELMTPYADGNAIGGMLYSSLKEATGFVNHVLRNRNEFGQQGQERVKEHYQWKQLLYRFEGVYEEVIAEKVLL